METTRRGFLQGAAVATAGVAGTCGMAGSALAEESWDEEYDVIVVGGGLAGTATALTVATEGDGATCLLLEKGSDRDGNGNSRFSAGYVWTTDNYDAALEYMKALRGNNPSVSDAICEAYVREMIQHADWLRSLGAPDDMTVSYESEGFTYAAEYPELDPEKSSGGIKFSSDNPDGYTHPQLFLSAKVEEYETITRKLEAPATELVQDPETKGILGVVYECGGKTLRARANKGVVMCCGGFEGSPELMVSVFKAYGAHPAAGVCNTGDGIRMCAKVGANMWHMGGLAGFWPNHVSLDGERYSLNTQSGTFEQGIMVGTNGRRFFMEWHSYGREQEGDELRCHVGMRHGDTQYGGEWCHTMLPEVYWFVFDQAGMDAGALQRLGSEDPVENGWGYRADTLEELAELIEVPAEELVATVDNWNRMCDEGCDYAFYRPTSTLNKIETGPFYATKMCQHFINTDGGAERDERGRILDTDGNPIPNLYGAGEFGSIWSDMYNGGGNLSECLGFGRISARNCLGIA